MSDLLINGIKQQKHVAAVLWLGYLQLAFTGSWKKGTNADVVTNVKLYDTGTTPDAALR